MRPGAAPAAPSYPVSYRIAATLAVLGLALGTWHTRAALLQMAWTGPMLVFVAAVVALVLMGYGHILGSRTAVHDDAIEHGWLWTDRLAWRDVSQVRLLHWPALAWLVAPRLMVHARGRGRLRIPLADPGALQCVRQRLFGPAD